MSDAGSVEEWVYQGGTFTNPDSWMQGGSSSGGNMILGWDTDAATTRKQVKQKQRKSGIQISYLHPDNGWINEQYVGTGFDDVNWSADSNWKQIAITDDIGVHVQKNIDANLSTGETLQVDVINDSFIEVYSENDLDKVKLVRGATLYAQSKNYIYAKATANQIIIQNQTQQYVFNRSLKITYCNGVYEKILENNYASNIFISDNKESIVSIPDKITFNDISRVGKNLANPENVRPGYWTTGGIAANTAFADVAIDVTNFHEQDVTITTSGNSIRVIGCELEDGSYTQEFNATTSTPYSYNIPSNAKVLHVSYGKSYTIQVELGNTATEYEPFERILDGINVELEKGQVAEENLDENIKSKINNTIVTELDYGTNLIDYTTEQIGKYFEITGVASNAAFSCVNTHDISGLAGKEVTVSAKISTSVRNIGYFNGDNKPIMINAPTVSLPYTFELPNDTIKELYISYPKVLDNPKNIQLELGESNTPYVDYVEPVEVLPKDLKVVPSEGTVGVDELNEELKEVIGGGFSFCPNYLYGKKINYIGDSMVAGHTISSDKIYPTLIGYRNYMTVRNYGYNGRYMTSKAIVSGTVKGVVDAYLDMDDDADYIVVWALTNDAREVDTGDIQMGEEESMDTTTVYGALNTLCPGLQKKYPKGKILFINIYTRNNSCPQVQEAVKKVCAKYAIPVFNVAEESGISWKVSEQTSALTLSDTYHLSEQGHEYFSYSLEQRLRLL